MIFRIRMAWPSFVLSAFLIVFHPERTFGQSNEVTISKEQLEELKRKAAEVDRLQQQLNQAQQELRALKGTNAVLVPVVRDENNRMVPLPIAVLQAVTNQPPTPPIANLPAIEPDATISVNDLLTYFETDPASANARFRNQTFAIRGYVTDFHKPLFTTSYEVNFRLPGHELHVKCFFRPPDEFTGVYLTSNGEAVVGRTYSAKTTFARVGADLTIRGYCEGVKDGAVQLGGCQYLVAPAALR